ncbi:hypothetical protein F5Y04DRAFT_293246 [Hypomontagnella monticulosa]|nr:hypothetical protein F5Y04DRAFT_293246 [Hypomontagnella monticulosa]
MCYQLIERYSACHCLYYQHAADRCAAYGQSGHPITTRTILVGYACQTHSPAIPSDADGNFTSASVSQQAFGASSIQKRPCSPKIQRVKNNVDAKAYAKSMEYGESDRDSADDGGSDDNLSSVEAFLFDNNENSSLTSRSSVESSTALEHLTDGFLYDPYLQDLWPQVVLRSDTAAEAKEKISLLILRYSLDLHNLARKQSISDEPTNLRIQASKFVKRKRKRISDEIYKQFWLPLSAVGQSISESTIPEKDLDESDSDDTQQQPDVDRFITLKGFLFDTEPFQIFRENIRLFVEQASSSTLQMTWFDSLRIQFENWIVPAPKRGQRGEKARLHWTCNCGLRLYDDYTEMQPGALSNLRTLLSGYGVRSRSVGDLESNNSNPSRKTNGNKVPPSNWYSRLRLDVRLPRFWLRKGYWEPGKCRRTAGANFEKEHNYLLTCLPFGRWVSKLYQQEICTIYSDQDFFSLLRMLYHSNRRRLSLSWLRRVKGIHFVQFDVHRTDLADIRSAPAIPPETLRDEYQYDPMPAQLLPPIGPNMLVHFFENPTHAGVLPDLYKRIPKKLRHKLTPCQVTGMSTGWGLQIVEGIDTFVFFICGCGCFLICLVVAISWSAAKQDIQGGFGIGGFLLAFMVFCGGIVHSSLDS